MALEDERSNPAGFAQLCLDLAMKGQLHAVEGERLDGACLGTDGKTGERKVDE
jgi:hypothetical protein